MSNVNDLIEIAKTEIKKLNLRKILLVKNLFKENEWIRISRIDRILLETLFLNYTNTTYNGITPKEKTLTSSSHQKHKKITDQIPNNEVVFLI
ncbi:DUF1413 domain-containing protein [Aminipila sp.]|uniref:DUF1413 domain-containing protein n=1 Tax=Aminipila sp. TaxID=2060095 RepID=UPI000ED28003|nr:DUF1413 domain-containing protein [Aminipila sp.]HCX62123.1 hypothetical protein [Clostridiales bacterium]